MGETYGLWIYTGGIIEVLASWRGGVKYRPESFYIHFKCGEEALAVAARSKQEAEEKIIDWAKRYSIQNFIFGSRKIKRDKLIVHIDRDSLCFMPVKRSRTRFYIDEFDDMALVKWPEEEVENDTN
jgi:hypothetical protein